ncbi:metallopeptidase family protein [Chloroflexia bacterium SDU3-3]|nr:metallopeptidase family protein [Chloroflexia bacterium SDU3-3]
MDEETFEAVVLEAINDLPEEFGRHLANVEVLVEAQPTPEHRRAARIKPWQTLYGLYQGVPLTVRQSGMVLMPDTITIFREPLSHDFPSREQLRAQIRRTVLHEIAHVFGISDDRLRELDAY